MGMEEIVDFVTKIGDPILELFEQYWRWILFGGIAAAAYFFFHNKGWI